jgi:hypothetical protein
VTASEIRERCIEVSLECGNGKWQIANKIENGLSAYVAESAISDSVKMA